ncbi:MAG TPA: nucleotidyltransferase family protein [Devosia sp.]|nr:nucleotidyltransferase family protein [Devosia sp.]
MSAPEPIVALVPAAGLARRFGGDKLLAAWRGKPLAAHIADTLQSMGLRRIAVCPRGNGPRAALFEERGFEIVWNDDPEAGLGRSLALGAGRAIALGAGAMLVCLADMPNVTAAHLLRLAGALAPGAAVATEAGGIRTPPAIFSAARLPALARLTGDRGGRLLLADAAAVPASAELVRDIDTPADLG